MWDGKEKPKSIMNDEELMMQYMETLAQTEDETDVQTLAAENPGKFDKQGNFQEVHR